MLVQIEGKRQLLHASGAVTPIFVYHLGERTTLQLLFTLLSLTLLASASYRKQIRLPLLYWLVDRLERPQAKHSFPAHGAIYYLLGLILSLLLFTTHIALACILAMSLGDAASTIIGKQYGAHRIPYNPHKSLEGSTACLIFAGLGAATQLSPPLSVVAGLASTLIESLPLPVDDNITIPLGTGALLTLITMTL